MIPAEQALPIQSQVISIHLSILSTTKANEFAITCSASFTGNNLSGQFSGPKGATCTLIVQARANEARDYHQYRDSECTCRQY